MIPALAPGPTALGRGPLTSDLGTPLDHLHHLGFSDLQAYGVLTRTLTSQAYMLASDDLFWISGWLSIAMIALIWLARRSYGGGAPVAAD